MLNVPLYVFRNFSRLIIEVHFHVYNMKTGVLIIVIFFGLFVHLSCKHADSKNMPIDQFESGIINVSFKGENSGYTWNFKQQVTHRLQLIKKARLKGDDLLSIQMNNGRLTGVNPGKARLYFLNDSLEVYASWGTKGEAKNENGNILFYKVSGDKLYLYDFGQKALKKYQLNNDRDSLMTYMLLKSTRAVYRACHVADNVYLYVNPSDSLEGYDFVITDSNKVTARIPVLKNADANVAVKFPQMVYDGSFVFSDESRYIAYFCNFTGMFIYFDKQNLANPLTVKTIDSTPPPKAYNAELAPNTFRLEITPSIMFFPASAICQNKLYILNAINPQYHFVLDIYNLDQKGEYEQSIYIPLLANHRPISIAVENNICYVLYNDHSIASFAIEMVKK
jgi:hypothetical protein